MKIRTVFVSNSSTSSYVCIICGDIESGWDMCLQEANMLECVHDHVFHEDCISYNPESYDFIERVIQELQDDLKIKDLELEYIDILRNNNVRHEYYELAERWWDPNRILNDEYNEYRYNFPQEYCPKCNFKQDMNNPVVKYILSKYKLSADDVRHDLILRYGHYEHLALL